MTAVCQKRTKLVYHSTNVSMHSWLSVTSIPAVADHAPCKAILHTSQHGQASPLSARFLPCKHCSLSFP